MLLLKLKMGRGKNEFYSEIVYSSFPNVGFADYYLKDGDIMRVQFILAYGRDIGGSYAVLGDASQDYYKALNKDMLTKLIADHLVSYGYIPTEYMTEAERLSGEDYIIPNTNRIKGLIYKKLNIVPVMNETDFDIYMDLKGLYINNESKTVDMQFSIKNPSTNETWDLAGNSYVYNNIHPLMESYEAIGLNIEETDIWKCLSITIENPAIEHILLPANSQELKDKTVIKIAMLNKDTYDIYYFEDELPNSIEYNKMKAISKDTTLEKEEIRNTIELNTVWFFKYMGAEGDAIMPEEELERSRISIEGKDINHISKDIDHTKKVPAKAYNKLGRWMSIGLTTGNNYGYFVETYKYPKHSKVEQDLYGLIASDIIIWRYATENLDGQDNSLVFSKVERANK